MIFSSKVKQRFKMYDWVSDCILA